jgi:CRISPR/Cas system-associated protein Cas5 (RAMP superfamily)
VEEVEEEEELFEVGEAGDVAFEHSCEIFRELLLIASVG